jgi:hypothetical protein
MKHKQKKDEMKEIDSLEAPVEMEPEQAPMEQQRQPEMKIIRKAAIGSPQQVQKEEPVYEAEENIQQQPQQTNQSLSETLDEKLREFGGSLVKLQEWCFKNLSGLDLYTAGFQLCLYATNQRLVYENKLRHYFKQLMEGSVDIPFDPRIEPQLMKLLRGMQ